MAPGTEDTQPTAISQDEVTAMLTTEVREAVRLALGTVLEGGFTALMVALPFERSPWRSDRRTAITGWTSTPQWGLPSSWWPLALVKATKRDARIDTLGVLRK